MTFRHDGRFLLIDPGTRPAAIVLRHSARRAEQREELVFARVLQHDLPAVLEGITLLEERPPGSRLFVVSSGGRDYRVQAHSLRVHHGVALYGTVLPLARFAFGQRLLWTVLLWAARLRWGQVLIRRMRG